MATAIDRPAAPTSLDLSGVLKALADPNRLRILMLLRQGETCVCEIQDALGLSQNLVSHHLRVLREAGLVIGRREPSDARWVHYSLVKDAMASAAAALGEVLDPATVEERVPRCGVPLTLDGLTGAGDG